MGRRMTTRSTDVRTDDRDRSRSGCRPWRPAGSGDAATAGSRPLATAIEGVWEPTVTILDCASGAVLVSFLSMDMYIHDGKYVGVGAPEPHTPGFGSWHMLVAGNLLRAISSSCALHWYGGIPNGRLRVSATIMLAADGNSFTATDRAETLHRWQLDIPVCCLWNPRGEEALLARLAVAARGG